MTERLHFPFSLSCIGEGNGNQLWCSCLENPRDRGAWWAAVYGVAQSCTRLKSLSSSSRLLGSLGVLCPGAFSSGAFCHFYELSPCARSKSSIQPNPGGSLTPIWVSLSSSILPDFFAHRIYTFQPPQTFILARLSLR